MGGPGAPFWCPRAFFSVPWKQFCLLYMPIVTILLICTWTTQLSSPKGGSGSIIYLVSQPSIRALENRGVDQPSIHSLTNRKAEKQEEEITTLKIANQFYDNVAKEQLLRQQRLMTYCR